MKISEIASKVGLTAKTIRFYESKGLLSSSRKENNYRDYNEQDVQILKKIKALRMLGVEISDIKLLTRGIITFEELLGKQVKLLEKENKIQNNRLRLCRELRSGGLDGFEEKLAVSQMGGQMYRDPEQTFEKGVCDERVTVGIDIGTTTVSAVVRSKDTVKETFTLPSFAEIPGCYGIQSVSVIISKVTALLELVENTYTDISAIGLTGQMHGCVYTDKEGRAISELYTWQNSFGNSQYKDSTSTYCEYLTQLCGIPCATGYALVTDFYLRNNGLYPRGAHKLSTVMDYVGMFLTGRKEPLVHPSNLASFGFYDVESGAFSKEALEKMGTDVSLLPKTGNDGEILGYRGKVPVFIAIGDNQAGVIGAAGDQKGHILINIGTGSQISIVSDSSSRPPKGCEIRHFIEGKYLECYSALCGGEAYALVERFCREICLAAIGSTEEQKVYDLLDTLMADYRQDDDRLKIRTSFNGTRQDPYLRGSINNISMHNFTPQQLIYGVMDGIAEELYRAYLSMSAEKEAGEKTFFVSGNCVRKNPILCKILEEKFGAPMHSTQYAEEAALGAAIYTSYYLE